MPPAFTLWVQPLIFIHLLRFYAVHLLYEALQVLSNAGVQFLSLSACMISSKISVDFQDRHSCSGPEG